jgi:hypothetical protein
MVKRYRLVLNVPNKRAGHWRAPVTIGHFGTVERALRAAERVLARHPSEETRYSRERLPYSCSLYDGKKPSLHIRGRGGSRGCLVRLSDAQFERLEAPTDLVPSVGELGYW